MSTLPKKTLTALVTGGSRGIGRAVSVSLASTIAETVFVNYLQNDVEANRTREMIATTGSICVLARNNLSDSEEIRKLFKAIEQSVGRLDVFVHCAALTAFKPVLDIKPNQWDLTMNIGARSFLECVQQCVPLMSSGAIVALSSLGGQRVVPNYGALGPTKSALEALVRYLAVELAPKGIRVNGVSGGFIQTDSIEKFPDAASMKQEAISRTPVRRIGEPEDIADVVAFLVSPAARWIYGQVIVADGGFSLR